jgi:hypothetical protein
MTRRIGFGIERKAQYVRGALALREGERQRRSRQGWEFAQKATVAHADAPAVANAVARRKAPRDEADHVGDASCNREIRRSSCAAQLELRMPSARCLQPGGG